MEREPHKPSSPPLHGSNAGDREGPIGPFPSWGWLYAAVIFYTVLLVLLLYLFTRMFNHGLP